MLPVKNQSLHFQFLKTLTSTIAFSAGVLAQEPQIVRVVAIGTAMFQ